MDQLNELYRQRNNLAIAFCKAALAAGWRAGRGIDTSKPDGDEWANVIYVVLPGDTQVSWHIAPSEVHLLENIPEFDGKWDGTFIARDKNWSNLIRIPKDPCANCLRPKSEHSGKHCPSPFTTVWHEWDYPSMSSFMADDER
ncbi:hypothetical protein D3C76_407090 [compost metagenome]